MDYSYNHLPRYKYKIILRCGGLRTSQNSIKMSRGKSMCVPCGEQMNQSSHSLDARIYCMYDGNEHLVPPPLFHWYMEEEFTKVHNFLEAGYRRRNGTYQTFSPQTTSGLELKLSPHSSIDQEAHVGYTGQSLYPKVYFKSLQQQRSDRREWCQRNSSLRADHRQRRKSR